MQALLNAPIRLHVGSEVQAARADTLWSFDETVTPAAPQREDGGAVPRSSRIPVNSLPRAAESPSSRCWFGAGPSPRGYSHAVHPGLTTCPRYRTFRRGMLASNDRILPPLPLFSTRSAASWRANAASVAFVSASSRCSCVSWSSASRDAYSSYANVAQRNLPDESASSLMLLGNSSRSVVCATSHLPPSPQRVSP